MRPVLRTFALVLVLTIAVASSSAAADDRGQRFAVAADHYRHQRWPQAAEEFARLLSLEPDGAGSGDARFYYGEALVQMGRWNEAREQFAELLRREPDGRHARRAMFRAGEAAYMIGDVRAASVDLRAFDRRYPDDPLGAYVLPYLGSIELQSGNADAARALFAQATERFKDGPLAAEARFGWAQSLHQSGRLEAARDAYRVVIQGGPPLAEPALLQLGTAENALGDYRAALDAFDQLAAEFPASALTDKGRLGRGYALYKLARYRDAEAALRKVGDRSPSAVEAAFWLALSQKAEHKWQAAVDTLRGIPDAPPHRLAPAIAFHTADALRRDGQLAAASVAFDRVLTQFSDSPWADDALLGQLHVAVEQEQHAESIRLADELATRFPDSPLTRQAALAKGQALAALDRPREALAALAPILRESSQQGSKELQTHALQTSAVCQAQLGNWDESRRMLAALSETETGDDAASVTTYQVAELALEAGEASLAQELFASVAHPDGSSQVASRAQSGLAWSHYRAGRFREAAEAFGQVLENDPSGTLAPEAALLRARSLENLKQFESAQAMYGVVIEQHPGSSRIAEALAGRARLYEQMNRPYQARENYLALIEDHPDFSELDAAIYRYAWLLRETDPAESDKQLQRLRNQFPQSNFGPDATLRLAESALAHRNFADAERLLSEITGPQASDAVREPGLYLAGRLEMARGRWSAAIDPLERLIKEFPDGDQARRSAYLIAEAQFRRGKYEDAARRFADLANQATDQQESWLAAAELRRAQSLGYLRRWSESLEIANRLSTRFPDFERQYEADYAIGRALAAGADFAAAREHYAKVIDSPAGGGTETAAMAQWMIGESYVHQENYAAALDEYAKVDEGHPRWHAAALLQAGKCAEALGRRQSAVEFYHRLLKQYPSNKLSSEATRRLSALEQRAAERSSATSKS